MIIEFYCMGKTSIDYVKNGNLIQENAKNISKIQYNTISDIT